MKLKWEIFTETTTWKKKKKDTRHKKLFCLRLHVSRCNKMDLVWFYCISTIVGYLIPNPLYTYILNIYDLVELGFIAYQPL